MVNKFSFGVVDDSSVSNFIETTKNMNEWMKNKIKTENVFIIFKVDSSYNEINFLFSIFFPGK